NLNKQNDPVKTEYSDEDGVKFVWDAKKKAYFPEISEDFIARHHMIYGEEEKVLNQNILDKKSAFMYLKEGDVEIDKKVKLALIENQITPQTLDKIANSLNDNPNLDFDENINVSTEAKIEESTSSNKEKKPQSGFLEENKVAVYVNNLPLDFTQEKFEQLMSKYGIIARDPYRKNLKLKLYIDKDTGDLKGDGICHYLKEESVDLAISLLHKSAVDGKKVTCEKAKFQIKGDYDPKRSKKRKLSKSERKKLKESRNRLFEWKLEEYKKRKPFESVVVLKNCFDSYEIQMNPMIKAQLKTQFTIMCKKYGQVEKITIYD
ncbi:MAG: HIV Tat-specific factor 1, partial [Paramarteilia canceri]